MKKPIVELLFEKAAYYADINSSIEKWAESMGVHLYKNQVEIINTLNNPDVHNINIIAARSAGKTYAVALGILKLCIETPFYEVLVFGPKQQQASRILEQITQICYKCKDTLYKEVDWYHSNKQKLVLFNQANITALGAQEGAQFEGFHASCAVVDEAHQVPNEIFNKRISPMLKAATDPKLVKIGITLFRNHFYDSCHNEGYTTLRYPWDTCENLFHAGTTVVDGVEYPTTIINDMPLSYKQERFPNNPELHFPSENNLTEEDFDTQYEMKWVDSINNFLTEAQLQMLPGEHSLLEHGRDTEDYFFGLDLAGGLLINQGIKRDFSSLSIIRRDKDGNKELVAAYEWQGDVVEQMEDIVSVIHPKTGVFKCVFGTADYGSLGPAVVDMLTHAGIPIAGIRYRSSEPTTGMPYKTAIFDNFFSEMQLGRVHYPNKRDMATSYMMKKHMEEWSVLERKVSSNGNVQIAAPANSDYHDDAVNSMVLACWAADKMKDELRRIQRRGMFAMQGLTPNISSQTTAGRFNRGALNMPAGLGKMLGGGGWRRG